MAWLRARAGLVAGVVADGDGEGEGALLVKRGDVDGSF